MLAVCPSGMDISFWKKVVGWRATCCARTLVAASKPTTPCPFLPRTRGLRQAKSWIEEVELDDRGPIFLLFGLRYDRENPEATKQNPK
jgi:hypothetical protein